MSEPTEDFKGGWGIPNHLNEREKFEMTKAIYNYEQALKEVLTMSEEIQSLKSENARLNQVESLFQHAQREIYELKEEIKHGQECWEGLCDDETKLQSQLVAMKAECEDNDRWMRDVLTDFRIEYDDHKQGRRAALTQWMSFKKEVGCYSTPLSSHHAKQNFMEVLQALLSTDNFCPEILMEGDGDFCLDWHCSKLNLSVSISKEGELAWAYLHGKDSSHGTDLNELLGILNSEKFKEMSQWTHRAKVAEAKDAVITMFKIYLVSSPQEKIVTEENILEKLQAIDALEKEGEA